MLKDVNYIWKYLFGFFLLLAIFMCFQGEAYKKSCVAGGECDYLPAGEYCLEIDYDNVNESSEFALIAKSLVTAENEQGVNLLIGEVPAGSGTLLCAVDVPSEARNVVLCSGGYRRMAHSKCKADVL